MSTMYKIKISECFSDTPGAGLIVDGENSGELFYNKILLDAFTESVNNQEFLRVDLDDCYGYTTDFLKHSFGKLGKTFGCEYIISRMLFVSNQDPLLVGSIYRIIRDEQQKTPLQTLTTFDNVVNICIVLMLVSVNAVLLYYVYIISTNEYVEFTKDMTQLDFAMFYFINLCIALCCSFVTVRTIFVIYDTYKISKRLRKNK